MLMMVYSLMWDMNSWVPDISHMYIVLTLLERRKGKECGRIHYVSSWTEL
jgi:hypothetical protein